jgi:hypothetical protein
LIPSNCNKHGLNCITCYSILFYSHENPSLQTLHPLRYGKPRPARKVRSVDADEKHIQVSKSPGPPRLGSKYFNHRIGLNRLLTKYLLKYFLPKPKRGVCRLSKYTRRSRRHEGKAPHGRAKDKGQYARSLAHYCARVVSLHRVSKVVQAHNATQTQYIGPARTLASTNVLAHSLTSH